MKSIIRRLETLEASLSSEVPCVSRSGRFRWRRSRTAALLSIKVRFGYLVRRLPPDCQGERHLEVARRLPNRGDKEWVEYEEVAGPAPNTLPASGIPRCINVRFVTPSAPSSLGPIPMKTREI